MTTASWVIVEEEGHFCVESASSQTNPKPALLTIFNGQLPHGWSFARPKGGRMKIRFRQRSEAEHYVNKDGPLFIL
ncbi:hypothetical protein [Sphingomonas sp. BK345]|uniref:hypothetical protein n=1 Tax=Sphingomonas sp. BK345 TaxID=2586980 RepID=UPI0016145E54|nr:hypothetical protein [Sphingomonas sp. BK345]MBB3475601.1 hypothetical protein [Sphingomonas sp. BK345]